MRVRDDVRFTHKIYDNMNISISLPLLLLAVWGAGAEPGSVAAQDVSLPPSVAAQTRTVTLAEARAEARAHSRGFRVAAARAEATKEAERLAAAARWPRLDLSVGATRSDDPVAAFGARLRHAAFTQADFDPAGLNRPDPLTDWSLGAHAAWVPLDLSRQAGVQAAGADAAAASLGAEWAGRAAEFGAVIAFLEALTAEGRLRAAQTAEEAAGVNLVAVRRRVEEGLLTDADVLQARAAAEGARATVIDATRAVADARDRLALSMGWSEGVVPLPTGVEITCACGNTDPRSSEGPAGAGVPRAGSVRRPHDGDISSRPDILASAQSVRGADARLREARRARLPRVEGFASLSTHSADLFTGRRETWTAGFQLRIPVFTGFAITAREESARAMLEVARLEHEDRLAKARVALDGAARAVSAAEGHLAAATTASSAAAEAARLMRRRFEEGLATVADLLAAEARAAELATREVDARRALLAAAARLDFLSTDTESSPASPGGMER